MRVDAHHHLWDPAVRDYEWMTGEAAVLARRFGLADLRAEVATTPIETTVLVQAAADAAETREMLAAARRSAGTIRGVVGWVDLTAPDVRTTLEDLMGSGDGPLLVGVRHQVHDEVDPQWLSRADVRRGLHAVSDLGLVFDLLVRPREMPAAITAARALPSLSFVLDHMGKPAIADGGFEPWSAMLADLASCENVSCKMSGLVTETVAGASDTAFEPYVDHAFEVFGSGRMLYGSDWPVCTLRCGYRDVWNLSNRLTQALSAAEKHAFFGDNAVRIYALL